MHPSREKKRAPPEEATPPAQRGAAGRLATFAGEPPPPLSPSLPGALERRPSPFGWLQGPLASWGCGSRAAALSCRCPLAAALLLLLLLLSLAALSLPPALPAFSFREAAQPRFLKREDTAEAAEAAPFLGAAFGGASAATAAPAALSAQRARLPRWASDIEHCHDQPACD